MKLNGPWSLYLSNPQGIIKYRLRQPTVHVGQCLPHERLVVMGVYVIVTYNEFYFNQKPLNFQYIITKPTTKLS